MALQAGGGSGFFWVGCLVVVVVGGVFVVVAKVYQNRLSPSRFLHSTSSFILKLGGKRNMALNSIFLLVDYLHYVIN